MRQGCDADHSSLANAEVVNEQELYSFTPCASIGVLWDFTFYLKIVNNIRYFLGSFHS
jgi:hypothetical protein